MFPILSTGMMLSGLASPCLLAHHKRVFTTSVTPPLQTGDYFLMRCILTLSPQIRAQPAASVHASMAASLGRG